MNLLDNLVFQMMNIFVPALSILFAKNKLLESKSKRSLLIVLAIFSALSGMTYAEQVTPAFMDDFRLIPIILVQMYFGFRVALITNAIILASTFAININHGLESFIITLLMMLVIMIFDHFEKINPQIHNEFSSMLKLFCSLYIVRISSVLFFQSEMIYHQTFYNFMFIPGFEAFTMIIFLYIVGLRKEKFLKEEQFAAIEKQRVASELAASIAHEIRNPITVVKGFVQLIQQAGHILTQEKVNHYLELCDSELDRAEYIIKDYLSFSRPQQEPLTTTETSINSCFNKMLSIVKSYSLLNSIEFVYSYNDEIDIQIVAYKEKLEQILVNIVKNAIEACATNQHPKVEFGAIECDKEVMIFVQDNGVGFSEEQLKSLGTAYQTTKSTGTGLGLMVCKRLIEEMNGRLQVVSELGKGSLIKIYIPISA